VRRVRLVVVLATATSILLAAGPVPRAGAQTAPSAAPVLASYPAYEGMGFAYIWWMRRAVSPSFPAPDPVAFNLGERAMGPLNGASQVAMGMTDLALVSQLAATESWFGRNDVTPGVGATSYRKLRALFPAYRSALLFLAMAHGPGPWAPDPAPTGLSPLANRRLLVWPRAEDTGDYRTSLAAAVLRTLSLPFQPAGITWELSSALYDNSYVDNTAVGFLDGLPNRQLEIWVRDFRPWLLVPSASEKTRLQRAFPFLVFFDIRPGGLRHSATTEALNAETLRTLGMWNFAVVRSDMPVCVAYRIVDAVMSAARRAGHGVQEISVDGSDTSYVDLEGMRPENFERLQDIPLHAGAALWLRTNNHPLPVFPRADSTTEICP